MYIVADCGRTHVACFAAAFGIFCMRSVHAAGLYHFVTIRKGGFQAMAPCALPLQAAHVTEASRYSGHALRGFAESAFLLLTLCKRSQPNKSNLNIKLNDPILIYKLAVFFN